MSVYAISDLHLSLSEDKPMDVFGGDWSGYVDKLYRNWTDTVSDEDTVIIPGDISWATYLEKTEKDFAFIDGLPGKKIIGKGNHDYWWSTMSKLNAFVKEKGFTTISFLHNNCYVAENFVICGTRGWDSVGNLSDNSNRQTFLREISRLKMSLEEGRKMTDASEEKKKLIVALHYPPTISIDDTKPIQEILKEYGADICIYGHLHGDSIKSAVQGNINGVKTYLVSADALLFMPKRMV